MTVGGDVTVANSGLASGRAFDAVVANGGSTVRYAATAANDTRGIEITPAANAQTYVAWAHLADRNDQYGAVHLRLTGYPAAANPLGLVRATAADGTTLAGVNIDNNGRIATVRTGGTVQATGTVAVVPLNTWVRVEWHMALGLAAGTVEARVFLSAEGTTPDEVLSAAGTADTSGVPAWYRTGMCTSRATPPAAFQLDTLAWGMADWPGPAPTADPVTPLRCPTGVVFHGVAALDVPAFETAAARGVAVEHSFQNWAASAATGFPTTAAVAAHNAGRTPMVTWEPWNSSGGVTQPTYTLASIINGNHDGYLDLWATGAKSFAHPLFVRFAHEMNGDWVPWSEQTNGNQPGQYAAAWRHVVDRLRGQGVTNVTWVWCPNKPYVGSTPLDGLYPGGGWVDWLGVDAYNFGSDQPATGWRSVATVFDDALAQVHAIDSAKPVMIAETGSSENGGDKAAWIGDLFARLKSTYTYVRGLCWFNYDKTGVTADWRIQTSTAATNAYKAGVDDPRYAPRRRPAFAATTSTSGGGGGGGGGGGEAATLANTFEGGTVGGDVTVENSGGTSGTAFTAVVVEP